MDELKMLRLEDIGELSLEEIFVKLGELNAEKRFDATISTKTGPRGITDLKIGGNLSGLVYLFLCPIRSGFVGWVRTDPKSPMAMKQGPPEEDKYCCPLERAKQAVEYYYEHWDIDPRLKWHIQK